MSQDNMLKPIFGDHDWIGHSNALSALNRQIKANSKKNRLTKAMLVDIMRLQSRVDYYAKKLENKGKAI
jgi:hypothetical protein